MKKCITKKGAEILKTGIEIIMGRPGIGKTTYLALMAKKSLRNGIPVYSNVDIAGCHNKSETSK